MLHILVVDDSEDVREYLALVLEGAGYHVSHAASAEEAFELVGRSRPDLVITDVVMPGQSGLDLLSRIHSDLAPPLPPVIVSSGFPDTEEEARRRGAALFLPKPTDPDDLVALVGQVLQNQAPEPAAVAGARAHTADARQGVHDAADEFVARVLERVPEAIERAAEGAKWLPRYFGFGSAVFVLAQQRAQRVIATSEGSGFQVGQPVDEALPQCLDILEAGSPLLLPDVAAHPSFAELSRSGQGVRFFAGVPFVAETGLRVGALCLASRHPHAFSVHDLAILDFLGRQISERYFAERPAPPDQLLFCARNLLYRPSFVRLLGIELEAARAEGDAVELAALELEGWRPDFSIEVPREAPDPKRSALGQLDRGQCAVYKRAASQESASWYVESAVHALHPFRAAGVMSVAADGPAVDGEQSLRFALEALAHAKRTGQGEIVRFVTRRHPWSKPGA